MKKLQNTSLCLIWSTIILFNQVWKVGHNEKLIESCQQHVLISVLTASKSRTVTTEGVAKKKEPTNLMPAEPKNSYQRN